MLEKGLRVTLDAPGKFEKVLEMLGMLEDMTERNEFSDDMHRLLLALYGQQPTLRGAGLLNGFVKLRKLRSEGKDLGDAKTVFDMAVVAETEEVLGEYELFLHEHVENTRAARIAAMAPSHAQWAAIIRQQNALHRQMERKIRLLDEMQERRRRRRGSATDLLTRLAGQYDRSGDAGGQPEPTTVSPSSSEEGSQPLGADTPDGGTSVPPEDVGAALVAAQGQPQGLPLRPDENTQNRGNEAKNSLKTNEVAQTNCANRTHLGARKARNEAKNTGFECTSRPFRNRKLRRLTATVAWEPRTGMVWGPRMRRSVA
jgi:hypothetical protein